MVWDRQKGHPSRQKQQVQRPCERTERGVSRVRHRVQMEELDEEGRSWNLLGRNVLYFLFHFLVPKEQLQIASKDIG